MPDITNLVTNTTLNAKINEVKVEIINIAIKKKNDYNTTVTEIKSNITTDHCQDKYMTTRYIRI